MATNTVRTPSDATSQWAAAEARRLMNTHGLHAWAFGWNRSKTSLGRARMFRSGAPGTIELSAVMTPYRTLDAIRQTLLHEIAHALVGPAAGHGPVWLRQARAIGYTGDAVTADEDIPLPPIRGYCPTGQHAVGTPRHRRPTAGKRYLCGRCRTPVEWVDTRVDTRPGL